MKLVCLIIIVSVANGKIDSREEEWIESSSIKRATEIAKFYLPGIKKFTGEYSEEFQEVISVRNVYTLAESNTIWKLDVEIWVRRIEVCILSF